MKRTLFLFGALIALILSVGCGSNGTVNTQAKLANNITNLTLIDSVPVSSDRNSVNITATSANIKSLKYYIMKIQICKGWQTTSTGTGGNGTDCADLYVGPTNHDFDNNIQDAGKLSTLARSVTNGFIDLMDSNSIKVLNASVKIPTGDYNYGSVTTYAPAKVTATLTNGTTTLYTHDGTNTTPVTMNGGNPYYPTVSSTSFASPPAEEAVAPMGGGGIYKFPKPFTVEKGKTYQIDLTFNPDGMIQGVTAPGQTNFPPLMDATSNANTISAPMAGFTPIAHSTDDTVVREMYTATVAANDSQDARLELYYLKSDAGKSVVGVAFNFIPNANTAGYITGGFYVNQLTLNADGSYTFSDFSGRTALGNFTRQSTVGGTTSALIPCGTNGGFPTSSSCNSNNMLPVTFTLKSLGTLN